MSENSQSDLMAMTADLVSAYVSNNSLRTTDLPNLLVQVHGALVGLSAQPADAGNGIEKPTPAQIRKSITPDALISFEDGKPYKTLRRHLTLRGLSPEAYRAKWGLAPDYPMTSANYSAQRSALARDLGLGQIRRREKPEASSATAPEPAAKPKRAGRPRKVAEPA